MIRWRWVLTALVLLAAGFFGLRYYRQYSETQRFRTLAREYSQKMGRGEGRLKPGDPAPDFRLKRLQSQDKVRLSSFAGQKPVALVFGSYT